LFTPSNWDELEVCIGRVVKDDALRERLAANAFAAVAAEFDVDKSAAQLRRQFEGESRR
jgi:glycosyltransferase involved in cell wall biosynthesis